MEEEKEVVEQAKSNPEAFGRLYDAYYQPIFGYLAKRVGSIESAQDLASETFFQAFKNIGRYRQEGKPFKAWLYAIAVAQVGNFFRARKRNLPILSEEFPEVAADEMMRPDVQYIEDEDNAEQKAQLVQMKRHLIKLKEKWQTILTLRYWQDMTIPEIAVALNMKEGTVKSHIHRALKRLQTLMAEEAAQEAYARTPEPKPYRELAHANGQG